MIYRGECRVVTFQLRKHPPNVHLCRLEGMFLFNRGTRRNRIESDVVRPTLSLHVPAFGGIVMKPISLQEDTFLTGQLEVEMPTVYQDGLDCEGLSVWLEGRWTDLEDDREKGTTVCFQQIAVVDVAQDQSLRLWPGTQR